MGKLFNVWNILIIFGFLLFVCSGLVTIFAEKTSLENDKAPIISGKVKGVVDRIEDDNLAVILVEEMDLEFIVSKNDFQTELAKNVWVDLLLVGGKIKELTIDWNKTIEEEKRIKELINELKEDKDSPL